MLVIGFGQAPESLFVLTTPRVVDRFTAEVSMDVVGALSKNAKGSGRLVLRNERLGATVVNTLSSVQATAAIDPGLPTGFELAPSREMSLFI